MIVSDIVVTMIGEIMKFAKTVRLQKNRVLL